MSQPCPNANHPYAHQFDTLYVGENAPQRIYCKACGQVRDGEPTVTYPSVPLDDRIRKRKARKG